MESEREGEREVEVERGTGSERERGRGSERGKERKRERGRERERGNLHILDLSPLIKLPCFQLLFGIRQSAQQAVVTVRSAGEESLAHDRSLLFWLYGEGDGRLSVLLFQ